MKLLKLQIGGRAHEAWIQKLGQTLWVHMNGETFTYEPEKKIRRKGAEGGPANSGKVLAPMPGKVTKISIELGELVEAGQTLVVLEAMKMEYTLKAPANGTVTSLSCKVGDQVKLGQALVKVEAPKDAE